MFQSLRQNSPIYIFHKGNNPLLEVGTITNVPIPRAKYPSIPNFGQPQEMVLDLTVKVGERVVNYNGLPATAEIADSSSNGESVVVSDSRSAMNAEIFSYKQRSIDIINSVEQHQSIIAGCDNILNDLNPEYAQKQQQQAELSNLKEQLAIMSKNMQSLMESNKQLVEQLNRKEPKNEQNVGNKGV